MSELVIAVLIVLGAGFAHASQSKVSAPPVTKLDATASMKIANDLEARWEAGDLTILRDPAIDTTHLMDANSDCLVHNAHGTEVSTAECTTY